MNAENNLPTPPEYAEMVARDIRVHNMGGRLRRVSENKRYTKNERMMSLELLYAEIIALEPHDRSMLCASISNGEYGGKIDLETMIRRTLTVEELYEAATCFTSWTANERFVSIYLQMGCDIDHLIRNAETFLHSMIIQYKVFDDTGAKGGMVLLNHGARVDIKNHRGVTQLEAARNLDPVQFKDFRDAMEAAAVPLPDVKVAHRN